MERIGIYGGSFDPPHAGHLRAAQAAIDGLGLDRLLLLPASCSPGKTAPQTPDNHRLAMLSLAAGEKMEVCDEICEATGAEGVAVIGTKFVIYRFSEKLQAERNQTGRAKRKPSKVNPVRKGAQARRQAARKVREQRNEYFRQMAIEKAIERSRERQLHQED